ncbi:hypothetical protein KTR66_08175 [Roseococcus sp. SDR]|uniref:hypothetical protein n=1 Tax=Roseococcus sp. SDR TaxID=2835532 RepID=UPI001BCFEE78|nr:hypothetical protein [Roseococcus sp. SDR]MBS7789967.1 hypothetical protein [Roseococcus sp. SDR]MBV1845281.1 hypothetical protein [Roseococcus sp. SDR]
MRLALALAALLLPGGPASAQTAQAFVCNNTIVVTTSIGFGMGSGGPTYRYDVFANFAQWTPGAPQVTLTVQFVPPPGTLPAASAQLSVTNMSSVIPATLGQEPIRGTGPSVPHVLRYLQITCP